MYFSKGKSHANITLVTGVTKLVTGRKKKCQKEFLEETQRNDVVLTTKTCECACRIKKLRCIEK